MAAVCRYGLWGYIDKRVEMVIMPQFEEVGVFREGLAVARSLTNSKEGYINKSGQWVVPPQFDGAEAFSEGLAAVLMNGKWGYIDTNGQMIIQPQFADGGCSVKAWSRRECLVVNGVTSIEAGKSLSHFSLTVKGRF